MPTLHKEPAGGFELEGMAALAEKLVPGIDLNASPENAGDGAAAAAEEAARKTVTDGAEGAVEESETAEEKAAREAEEAAAGEETAEQKAAREAEEAAAGSDETPEAKAERKEKEEAARKAAEAEKADDPDADLETAVKEVEPHTRPKTKKLIEFLKTEGKTARAAQRALAAEKTTLEQKLAAAEAKAASGPVPKELEEKIARYEEQIRELDAARDPEIVRKFDTPIERNRTAIIDILKTFGLGKTEDGKDDPTAIPTLLASGLSFKTLKEKIEKMKTEGFDDEAAAIEDALRDNIRLTREKSAEISTIKTQVGERVAARTKAQNDQSTALTKQVYDHAGQVLTAALDDLKKSFKYLEKPPAPAAGDAPAVAKAKREALAEFDADEKKIGALAISFNEVGKSPAEAIKARGDMVAHAIQAALMKTRLIPRLQKQLSASEARVKDLETQLGKYRKAGDLNRAHGAAVGKGGEPVVPKTAPGAETGDAFKDFAKAQGIAV